MLVFVSDVTVPLCRKVEIFYPGEAGLVIMMEQIEDHKLFKQSDVNEHAWKLHTAVVWGYVIAGILHLKT